MFCLHSTAEEYFYCYFCSVSCPMLEILTIMWDKAGLRGTPARLCGCALMLVISSNSFGMTSMRNVMEPASSVSLMIVSVVSWSCHLYLKTCPFFYHVRKLQITCLGFHENYYNARFCCRAFWFIFFCEWCFLLYLLISNSLMNKLNNGNRWKKSSARVTLTILFLIW